MEPHFIIVFWYREEKSTPFFGLFLYSDATTKRFWIWRRKPAAVDTPVQREAPNQPQKIRGGERRGVMQWLTLANMFYFPECFEGDGSSPPQDLTLKDASNQANNLRLVNAGRRKKKTQKTRQLYFFPLLRTFVDINYANVRISQSCVLLHWTTFIDWLIFLIARSPVGCTASEHPTMCYTESRLRRSNRCSARVPAVWRPCTTLEIHLFDHRF